MCSPDGDTPSPEAAARNLRQQMPLVKKIGLFTKNNALKVVRLKSCCGNYGQPGC